MAEGGGEAGGEEQPLNNEAKCEECALKVIKRTTLRPNEKYCKMFVEKCAQVEANIQSGG